MIGLDFETYSEVGLEYDPILGKWNKTTSGVNKGLRAVGAAVYSEHPSTSVDMLTYERPDGTLEQWKKGDPDPVELFKLIADGHLFRAANSGFEYLIWLNVCHSRMGWPLIPLDRFRCTLSKARAYGLPGKLADAAAAIGAATQKMTEGKALINKFSMPRNPTRKDFRLRLEGSQDEAYLMYNRVDVEAERDVDALIPDLSAYELDVWKLDQRIAMRGVAIDTNALHNLWGPVLRQTARAFERFSEITGGLNPSQKTAVRGWLETRGIHTASVDADHVAEVMSDPTLPPDVREALEQFSLTAAASVKKIPAIKQRLCKDDRIRDILLYCGAGRTWRWAGRGPQPQNLPNKGPTVAVCEACGAVQSVKNSSCHLCPTTPLKIEKWNPEIMDAVMSYDEKRIDEAFDDPISIAAGCLRGLFVAGEGMEFICSDYSAIEAVVLACLAGEQWRIDVFITHGKIYEMSASAITGVPFEDMLEYKERTGDHHPARKTIGKVAELASGYQGGIGAWKQFGADEFMTDDEIKEAIRKWREASPNIVNFWYGVERCAVAAIKNPGQPFHHNDVTFVCSLGGPLLIGLPSGRNLTYHDPVLRPDTTPWGRPVDKITFRGVDADTGQWVRQETYGGKLTENITQAVARDLLSFALLNLDAAGYTPVLHVHDEVVSEVPKGFGSIEQFEQVMARVPSWATGWPVKAAGGWRGHRYRKD